MRLFIGFLLVLSLAFLVSCRYASWDKKFFLQRPFEAENEVLLIVTMSRGREQEVLNCEIVTNEKIMQDILNVSRNNTIKRPSPEDMQDLLEDCAKFNVRTKRSADEGTYSETDRRNTSNNSRIGNNSGASRTTSNRQNISSETRLGNENNADESRSRNSRRNNTSESPTIINRKYISNESSNGTSGKNNRNKSHNTRNNFNEPFNENTGRNQTNESGTGANRQNSSKDYLPIEDERKNYNETRSRNSRRNNTSDKENKSNTGRSNDSKNNATVNKSAEDSGIEVATSVKETEDPYNTITTTEGYSGWPVIFPGTKWCGAGDLAKDYDDLGMNEDSDRCCRAHDLCNDTLAPGATKNNLTNTSPFTKLSCKCDEDFYNCLDSVNSFTSNTIGNMYFNILRRECYQADYPLTSKCKTYRTFFKLSCKEYERDTSAPMVYQWVSAKRYKKIPLPGPLSISLPFK